MCLWARRIVRLLVHVFSVVVHILLLVLRDVVVGLVVIARTGAVEGSSVHGLGGGGRVIHSIRLVGLAVSIGAHSDDVACAGLHSFARSRAP